MEQPIIPQLNSRYIPVLSPLSFSKNDGVNWWKDTSDFIYPYLLTNLMTVTREEIDEEQIHEKKAF